jgi:hypothetical protein
MLLKLQSMPGPNDPAVIARNAERKVVSDARKAAKAAAAELARLEQVAREAAEQQERELAAERAAQQIIEDEKAKKIARDLRYAARKAAKKG